MSKLIIKNASELVTCKGKSPKHGKDMSDIGMIKDGCVVIEDEIIVDVGSTEEILKKYNEQDYEIIDAKDKAVLPGFIDSHTHFIFGGYRADEFSWRLRGDSYMSIMERGGGITSSVRSTRNTSLEEFINIGKKRLDKMMAMGVTTVEGKSGYGLDCETELRQLEAMKELNKTHAMDIVPTFLGPHSVLPEYKGKENEFLDMMINEVLPVVADKGLAEFADIFCEKNVFSIEQSRKFLSSARKLGLKLKIHADEIVQLGGTELAVELSMSSADHLLQASDEGIKQLSQSNVIATLLPATAFCLKEEYARGRFMIDSGCAVALATDFNPGSCFTNSIPLVIALAALHMKMSIEEIISALTINAAAAVGREDKVGSIEIGKKADIVILEYPSIHFLPYHVAVNIVETVIKNGKVIKGE
ncbi:imidazolonepropionase [Sedimentibacter acidaminivorans]|jgi:imidazolonepropionase|uniref:Imidazolonepropionase n=1 Tax=Sedimentibacter acidaminivorans TaxID=913099 RepID=A0ABS4GEK0_9FIRM|nr:imidazolonepropionase [Sedimentibacter acidaminivorans]MBP1926114.1 imidazolonepropionase [Sedimentibacter acidaminivorans]